MSKLEAKTEWHLFFGHSVENKHERAGNATAERVNLYVQVGFCLLHNQSNLVHITTMMTTVHFNRTAHWITVSGMRSHASLTH